MSSLITNICNQLSISKTYDYYDAGEESIKQKTLGVVGRIMRWVGLWHKETHHTNYINAIHAAAIDGNLQDQAQKVFSAIHSYQEDPRYGSLKYCSPDTVKYIFTGEEGNRQIDHIEFTTQFGSSKGAFYRHKSIDTGLAIDWPIDYTNAITTSGITNFACFVPDLLKKLHLKYVWVFINNDKEVSSNDLAQRKQEYHQEHPTYHRHASQVSDRAVLNAEEEIQYLSHESFRRDSYWGIVQVEGIKDAKVYEFLRNREVEDGFLTSIFFQHMTPKNTIMLATEQE